MFSIKRKMLRQIYSWLQKKTGNCEDKIDTFSQFFHSVITDNFLREIG
jgi:hypothetical protein